jgi:hypothetical protein
MLANLENLNDFNEFAHGRLVDGGSASMRDLFRAWLELREQNEVVADMEASDADIAAGRVTPINEAIAEIRTRLGIRK